MKEFEFTLKFALEDTSVDASSYIDALGEAGCDDALIGVGQKGRIGLNFCREGDTAMQAIISALKDVYSVIPNARLIEAAPDLVGISDIAGILAVSRQNIRKIVQVNIETFPPPLHEGKSAIYHLFNVLDWFKDKRAIEPALIEVARMNMQVNIAKENAKSEPEVQTEIHSVFA